MKDETNLSEEEYVEDEEESSPFGIVAVFFFILFTLFGAGCSPVEVATDVVEHCVAGYQTDDACSAANNKFKMEYKSEDPFDVHLNTKGRESEEPTPEPATEPPEEKEAEPKETPGTGWGDVLPPPTRHPAHVKPTPAAPAQPTIIERLFGG